MPSPRISNTVPPCSCTAPVMLARSGLKMNAAFSASTSLMALVDPLMSANRTETILRTDLAISPGTLPLAVPHSPQNLAVCAFVDPHCEHVHGLGLVIRPLGWF